MPWFKGVVREVVSADTLVIAGIGKPGVIPPEKRVSLSSLIAPRLVSCCIDPAHDTRSLVSQSVTDELSSPTAG